MTVGVLLTGCPGTTPTTPSLNASTMLFEVMQRYAAGDGPYVVEALDLNDDDILDLVTVDRNGNTVSVLMGNDSGGYAEAVTYATGDTPSAMAIADVNIDTFPDIVVSNSETDDISIFLGVGDGTFTALSNIALTLDDEPLAIALAEVTGDTHVDIITANGGSNTISILAGNSDATFAAPSNTNVGQLPRSIFIGDIDDDDEADILTANRNDDTVTFIPGSDVKGLDTPVEIELDSNATPRTVQAADLTGNDLMDIVVSQTGRNSIAVLEQTNARVFDDPVEYDLDFIPTRIILADQNDDDDLDIIAVLFSDEDTPEPIGLCAILLGDGSGDFDEPIIYRVGKDAWHIDTAFVNDDGLLDFIVAEANNDSVGIVFGKDDDTLAAEIRIPVGESPREVLVAKLNNDGDDDIIVLDQGTEEIIVLLGNGDGTFDLQAPIDVGTLPRAMALGYIDDDYDLDLAVTHLNNAQVGVFLGDGDGDFGAQSIFSLNGLDTQGQNALGTSPRSVAIDDMNGDNDMDLITANSGSDTISILLGDGSGTSFQAAKLFRCPDFPLAVHTADFNGDLIKDVMTTHGGNPEAPTNPVLIWRPGVGDGTLQQTGRVALTTGNGPVHMDLEDLTGDGDPDAVTVNASDDSIRTYTNHGSGTFGVNNDRATSNDPNTVLFDDLTKDGLRDILVTGSDDTLDVFVNQGSMSFSSANTFPVGTRPAGAAVGRFNGDSFDDFVTVNRDTGDISILFGQDPSP